ncbi:helix-turn-helix domain-containing protein [Paenibacillus sp. NPDC058071]|uniref:helix-turn-helix domain-containing protein n=1 Tax=Paenibacillus sp. NPDC058071 TaxID=3346326 RepID=UPI0036DE33FF
MVLHHVYVWTDISLLTEGEYRCSDSPALLLPIGGKAGWRVNGQTTENMMADAYVLPAHSAMSFENASGNPWSAFLISFKSIAVTNEEQRSDTLAADEVMELYTASLGSMIGLAEQLYQGRDAANETEAYKLHALFQKIMHLALEAVAASEESDYGAVLAVKKSIAHIQNAFAEPIQYADLARNCGLSPRHYSRIFRKLTGMSPVNYIIQSRIIEAKRLLSTASEPIQQVAIKSGFSDPFHFSRTFKRHVGLSPRLYVNLHREQSRVAVSQYLGELLAIGVKPVGAPKLLLSGKYVRHLVEGVAETGSTVVSPDMDRLKGLEPDAIFTFDGHHYDQYSQIAPTLNVPWSQPAFHRFKLIASLLGRDRQADDWIQRYESQVHQVQRQLKERLGQERTVSFWYIREFPNKFDVYYEREMMYNDLGLNPPPAVQRAKKEQPLLPFKQSKDVTEMPLYAGDHMFVVVDRKARKLFDQLRKGQVWRNLPAVQAGRVYVMTTDWLFVDPISRLGHLRELPEILKD